MFNREILSSMVNLVSSNIDNLYFDQETGTYRLRSAPMRRATQEEAENMPPWPQDYELVSNDILLEPAELPAAPAIITSDAAQKRSAPRHDTPNPILFNNDAWRVVAITDHAGARQYGRRTTWCTSWESSYWYKTTYALDKGQLFTIQKKRDGGKGWKASKQLFIPHNLKRRTVLFLDPSRLSFNPWHWAREHTDRALCKFMLDLLPNQEAVFELKNNILLEGIELGQSIEHSDVQAYLERSRRRLNQSFHTIVENRRNAEETYASARNRADEYEALLQENRHGIGDSLPFRNSRTFTYTLTTPGYASRLFDSLPPQPSELLKFENVNLKDLLPELSDGNESYIKFLDVCYELRRNSKVLSREYPDIYDDESVYCFVMHPESYRDYVRSMPFDLAVSAVMVNCLDSRPIEVLNYKVRLDYMLDKNIIVLSRNGWRDRKKVSYFALG